MKTYCSYCNKPTDIREAQYFDHQNQIQTEVISSCCSQEVYTEDGIVLSFENYKAITEEL